MRRVSAVDVVSLPPLLSTSDNAVAILRHVCATIVDGSKTPVVGADGVPVASWAFPDGVLDKEVRKLLGQSESVVAPRAAAAPRPMLSIAVDSDIPPTHPPVPRLARVGPDEVDGEGNIDIRVS